MIAWWCGEKKHTLELVTDLDPPSPYIQMFISKHIFNSWSLQKLYSFQNLPLFQQLKFFSFFFSAFVPNILKSFFLFFFNQKSLLSPLFLLTSVIGTVFWLIPSSLSFLIYILLYIIFSFLKYYVHNFSTLPQNLTVIFLI